VELEEQYFLPRQEELNFFVRKWALGYFECLLPVVTRLVGKHAPLTKALKEYLSPFWLEFHEHANLLCHILETSHMGKYFPTEEPVPH